MKADGSSDIIYQQALLFVFNGLSEDYRVHQEWSKFSHIVPFLGAAHGDIDGVGNIAINDVTDVIDMLHGRNR